MDLGHRSSAASVPDRCRVLDHALEEALSDVRVGSPEDLVAAAERARKRLHDALDGLSAAGGLRQALACAEAAGEHLGYGELLEARTLLTAARRQLALLSAEPAQQESAQQESAQQESARPEPDLPQPALPAPRRR
jgi:hypothetical protein